MSDEREAIVDVLGCSETDAADVIDGLQERGWRLYPCCPAPSVEVEA